MLNRIPSRPLMAVICCLLFLVSNADVGAATLQELNDEITAAVEKASPAVVEVRAQCKISSVFLDEDFPIRVDHYIPPQTVTENVGSGFVFDSGGYVLTTGSVVKDAVKITVTFADGAEVEAQLMGIDPLTDAAVLKVEKSGLAVLELGESDALTNGSLVLSLGSQPGMPNATSLGMVAGMDTVAGRGTALIRISGSFGPGASGGPVLGADGKVVGMTVAMMSSPGAASNLYRLWLEHCPEDMRPDSGHASEYFKQFNKYWEALGEALEAFMNALPQPRYQKLQRDPWEAPGGAAITPISVDRKVIITDSKPEDCETMVLPATGGPAAVSGTGFAVPIDMIKPILQELKQGIKVQRGWLGAEARETRNQIVLTPIPEGPAESAQIEDGDVVISADGRECDSVIEFVNYIGRLKPDAKLTLVIKRGGDTLTREVTLGTRPPDILNVSRPESTETPRLKLSGSPILIDLENADIEEVARRLSSAFDKSIVVLEPKQINTTVSMHLKCTNIEQALDVICKVMGCTYAMENETYIIEPK